MTAAVAISTTVPVPETNTALEAPSLEFLTGLPGVQLAHLQDILYAIRETGLGACNQPRAVSEPGHLLTEGAGVIEDLMIWCDAVLGRIEQAAEQRAVTDEDDAKACAWVRVKGLAMIPDQDGLADLVAVVNASMLRVASAAAM